MQFELTIRTKTNPEHNILIILNDSIYASIRNAFIQKFIEYNSIILCMEIGKLLFANKSAIINEFSFVYKYKIVYI